MSQTQEISFPHVKAFLHKEREISMGRLSDWYGAFDLYGGIRGFRKIARDEVVDLSPRNLEFMCRALNLDITETRCYKQAQLRKARLDCEVDGLS